MLGIVPDLPQRYGTRNAGRQCPAVALPNDIAGFLQLPGFAATRGMVSGFGPVRAAENGGGGHGQRADSAGGVPVPEVFFDGLQDLVGDGQDIAALLACDNRLTLIADARGEVVELRQQSIRLRRLEAIHRQKVLEEMVLQMQPSLRIDVV